MVKKTLFASLVSVLVFLAPMAALAAEGTNQPNMAANTSPIGTLNPDNMGQTDMSNADTANTFTPGMNNTPATPGTTYTGTESIQGSNPLKGNGHYDMSGTGVPGITGLTDNNGMNTVRSKGYRAMAADGTNRNWGWLGLLGLIGLAGLFNRNRNGNRDPV